MNFFTLQVKCESYLPDICGKYGEIDVLVTDITEREGYTIRQITLKVRIKQQRYSTSMFMVKERVVTFISQISRLIYHLPCQDIP